MLMPEPEDHAASLQRAMAQSMVVIGLVAAGLCVLVAGDDRAAVAVGVAGGSGVGAAFGVLLSVALQRVSRLDEVDEVDEVDVITSTPDSGWRSRSAARGRRRGGALLVVFLVLYIPVMTLLMGESWPDLLTVTVPALLAVAAATGMGSLSVSRWEEGTGRLLFTRRDGRRIAWTSSQARQRLIAVEATPPPVA